MPGDVDCDGEVLAADLGALVAEVFGEAACEGGDVNDDGLPGRAGDVLALMIALASPDEQETPAPTPTEPPAPKPSGTSPEPTSTPTRTPAPGPLVIFFGLAGANGRPLPPTLLRDGIPVYERPIGLGFRLVVEAAPGLNGNRVGSRVIVTGGRPDLQIQSTQPLGNGSARVCEGGVPALMPPDFGPRAGIDDALNDFGCHFRVATSAPAACTLDEFQRNGFVEPTARIQFCALVDGFIALPRAETLLTLQVADSTGVVGEQRRLIVRVALPPEPTTTPTVESRSSPTPTRSFTPAATVAATSTRTFAGVTPTQGATTTTPPTSTPAVAATPSRTPTSGPGSTITRTSTIGSTATSTRTGTRTGTPTPTATATCTPTSGPDSTVTRTSTIGPTATITRTATRTATPVRTRTATRTHTSTPVPTSTRTSTIGATSTITRTPTTTRTITRTGTTTPTPTATRTRTRTRTPTATGIAGPVITYFGVTNADGTLAQPIGETDAGVPIYSRQLGFGFRIVVEGRRGADNVALGQSSYSYEPGNPSSRPDLQIVASRPLGNGSAAVCDNTPSNFGGVPAVSPPSFDLNQRTSDAMNDFGCRFVDGSGIPRSRSASDACVLFPNGEYRFADSRSQVEFCALLSLPLRFPLGDTLLTVRLRDVRGNTGAIGQIVLRTLS